MRFPFRHRRPASSTYIPAQETVESARGLGLSVSDYVERKWGQVGLTDRVIERMAGAGALGPTDHVVEIGPGTGRYLERVIAKTGAARYEIYETAADWRGWLVAKYGVVAMSADGETLGRTKVGSAGLIHAHGLFVYLPYLVTQSYFREIVRVSGPSGWVVFDFFSEAEFDPTTIDRWLATSDRHPAILPVLTVKAFFFDHGFELVDEFTNRYGQGQSRYVVLRRMRAA